MTVFGSSLESIRRWKSETFLNKQTIGWKVLCTLFTRWCAHLQPERIYRCRSISVGSSNFFQHLRIFGTLDRWFGWRNGLLEISILWPSHRTAPGKPGIQPFSDLLLSIYNQHLSQNRRNSRSARCVVSGKEIVTGKFSSLLDVFGRFYWSVMIIPVVEAIYPSKVMKPPASIQEPHSAHFGQFHLRFSVDCIRSKQMQQISMTSSGRSRAFTSSNLLPSLTTSFRRWHLSIFGDAILGIPNWTVRINTN